jgi:hypothetical protein
MSGRIGENSFVISINQSNRFSPGISAPEEERKMRRAHKTRKPRQHLSFDAALKVKP